MTVGVVGTGRFGAFWATQLAARHDVLAYNRSPRPVPSGCRAATLAEIGSCDAIFLCVAISSIEAVLEKLVPVLRNGSVVLDTCSVKVYPVEVMARTVPPGVEIIATHPMFGPDSARDGVAGQPLVFSPIRCAAATRARWEGEFRDMGLRLIEMSAEEHDREAAYTQGVTHFVGRVLADMDLRPSEIATVGYERLLAVMEQTCNDPYQLFADLQHYNPFTTEMRRSLQASLSRLLESLESQVESRDPPRLDSGS
jgi:prephenate dehydrogenase